MRARVSESPLESLVLEGSTRIVLVVMDGVGDLPGPGAISLTGNVQLQ